MSLTRELDRLEVKKMSLAELDLGFALATGLPVRKEQADGDARVEIMREDGQWSQFSPTGSWADFGYAVGRVGMGIVLGVHRDTEENKVRYYSAHAFIGGTSFDHFDDLRVAAAMSATAYGKQLDWEMVAEVPQEKDVAPSP